jgi:hypothetical protein
VFLVGAAVKSESPPAGNPAVVDGVPFFSPAANAEGKDHIDVGRGRYRQANLEG